LLVHLLATWLTEPSEVLKIGRDGSGLADMEALDIHFMTRTTMTMEDLNA